MCSISFKRLDAAIIKHGELTSADPTAFQRINDRQWATVARDGIEMDDAFVLAVEAEA